MASTTSRLGLTLPDPADTVDVTQLNADFTKIDNTVGFTPCTSTTRPSSPVDGQAIYETDTHNTYLWNASTTTWQSIGSGGGGGGGGISPAVFVAKGDLLVATAAATPARIPVGLDGQVLTADSTSTAGLHWSTPTGGGGGSGISSVTATNATITVSGTASAPTIAVGSVPESQIINLVSDLAAKLAAASNLADLPSKPTARTNLGLAAIAASGSASDLIAGTAAPARLGTGTTDSTTFLRGDGTWAPPPSAGSTVATNAQTGSAYTLVIGDAGVVVERNNAAANTLTVPPNSSVAFPVGTVLEVCQTGAGQTTLTAGAGVTFRPSGTLATRAQWATVGLRKRATDEWVISGDLA